MKCQVYTRLTDNAITGFASLILIELVIGMVVGLIPPPVSLATITMMENDSAYAVAEQGKSWLQVAQESNDSFFLTRGIVQLFFIAGAPLITTVSFVRLSR